MNRMMTLLLLFPLLFTFGCGCEDDCNDNCDSAQCEDCVDDDDNDDSGGNDNFVIYPVTNEAPPWPGWVLRHWVWEDESTQDSALALVNDYLEYDIPVGAIIIDSPWETGYNTFIWDETKYPDAQEMIDTFHDQNVRVFMWITANVNTDSPDFEYGLNHGYYVNNGRTLSWWKGDGAFIDYTNPEALAWWHGLMDKVLDMGIDGWKTDGSAFSMWQWLWVPTSRGIISVKEYQEMYYRDFFYYTRERLGPDRVITARPVDSYSVPFYGPDFAPREVNFAGWVGDQDPDWWGLNAAMTNMVLSARKGFVNFGSDIGGYRGDDLREKDLFIRWAQLGAFCPIMENGGAGEHRPWMYDDQTLEIYRKFTGIHHNLLPYLYSQGALSYKNGVSLMRFMPTAKRDYFLGENIFVASIMGPVESRRVFFPEGAWIDFWDGTEYAGLSQVRYAVPLDSYPVFVRKGAIIPMDLGTESVFENIDGALPPLTVSLYPDPGNSAEFDVYEEKGDGARITATYQPNSLSLTLTSTPREYAFRVMNTHAPGKVTTLPHGVLDEADDLDALSQSPGGWYFDEDSDQLWIKPGDAAMGLIVQVQ